VLGVALMAAVPFVASRCYSAFGPQVALADRGLALLNVAVVLAGFFGFMGADTTAGGSVWAALVLGILCADIGLRGLSDAATALPLAATAVGTACATTLAALGAYHLLAAWLGGDARRAAQGPAGPISTLP